MTGRVVSITPNSTSVRLEDGRIVTATNTTGTRCPPRSQVVMLQTNAGWMIVGRVRGV